MPPKPGNIKVVVAAGVPLPEAIKASLRVSCRQFALERGFFPPHVSSCIHGRQRHEKIRAALAEELGVEREWLEQQLDELAERRAKAAA